MFLKLGLSERRVVDQIYLSAYSRYPTDQERQSVSTALAQSWMDKNDGRRLALEDLLWAMTPQEAVESPRFQTEHFYTSFAFHEFVPGRVNLEGRMPKATGDALATLGHKIQLASDWSNSSAPTVILKKDGVLNGAADPRRARFIFGR